MKKLLFVLLAFAGAVGAKAYDYPYLVFQKTDGSIQSVSVEALTLTVEDGRIVVRNSEENTAFALTELSKMYFSSISTGITETDGDETSGIVDVYSVSGVKVGSFSSLEQARCSLGSGMYIIKTKTKTQKIAIR